MRERGFTLIELLLASALMAVVMVLAMGAFNLQNQTYMVVDQVSETQQNTTAIARLIERDIRNAGYLVAPGSAACGVDNTNAPDMLFVSDTDAILPADQLPVEVASEVLGARTAFVPLAGGVAAVAIDDIVLDENPTYDENGDGTLESDFQVGGGAIVMDMANPGKGIACGFVTNLTLAPPFVATVNFQNQMAAVVGDPPDVRMVPAIAYWIDNGATPPRLMRNDTVIAKDVEDLQIAWFYDDDDDGVVDANEVRGVVGTNLDTTLVDPNELREIRFNVVVRTRTDDPRNPDDASTGQSRENRTANVPGDDGKRRRVHTATVRLRNIQL